MLKSNQSLSNALSDVETRALAEDLVGGVAVDATLVLALTTDSSEREGSRKGILGVFKDRTGGGEGGSVELSFLPAVGKFRES